MSRYPEVRVWTRTPNPLLLVAVVRQELRRAGIESGEIDAFSEAALSAGDEVGIRRVCGEWVDTQRLDTKKAAGESPAARNVAAPPDRPR